MEIRRAGLSDATALVATINAAFQVERFFIDRDRIDLDQVCELVGKGEFLMADGAGCVYLEPRGQRCYLGLLSVDPSAQGTGLGRRLMNAAEDRAWELGCEFTDIRVVNVRTELPPFYKKLGYVYAGMQEFTPEIQTLIPCHFVLMSKALRTAGV